MPHPAATSGDGVRPQGLVTFAVEALRERVIVVPTSSADPRHSVETNSAKRWMRVAIIGLVALTTPFIAIIAGPADVTLGQVVGVIASHIPGIPIEITWNRNIDAIVWTTRLPRSLLALGVGAVLGVSGVVLQAVARNALAEPYVLGISSGAGAGCTIALLVLGISSTTGVGIFAFAGAVGTLAIVVGLTGRSPNPLRLVLAGLAVGFSLQAVTNLVIFTSGRPEANQAIMFWMLGSLGRATWRTALTMVAVAVALTVLLVVCSPLVDALSTGDRTAQGVGVNPGRLRVALLVPVSAAVALAVSFSGAIGFVGLIIPHLMRRWTGHAHRALVCSSALAGAGFLTLTDTVGRVVAAPMELPIGVVTGLIGGPFLAYALTKGRLG